MAEEIKKETSDTLIKTDDAAKTVPAAEQTDTLAQLKAKEDEILRLRKEREDFKRGMLKYKRQAKEAVEEEDDEEEDLSSNEKIRQVIREELINSEIGKKEAEHKAFIEKIAKENSELKLAIKNRSQISNFPGGSSVESQSTGEVSKESFTPEQLNYLKAVEKQLPPGVKIDPQKVLENWKKVIKK